MDWQTIRYRLATNKTYLAGFIVALIVFIVAVRYFTGRAAEVEAPADGEPAGDQDPWGGGEDAPTFAARPGGGGLGISVANPATNAEWGQRAVPWLYHQPGISISEAQRAIQRYLNEEPYTPRDEQLRDMAIRQFGLPPEPPEIPDPVQPDAPEPAPEPEPDPPAPEPVPEPVPGPVPVPGPAPFPLPSPAPPKSTRPPIKIYFKATQACRSASDIAARNGISVKTLRNLNPDVNFPVSVGKRVVVGLQTPLR